MKVIVIGTNHAGTTLCRSLKNLDKNIEVTTYDRNTNISFLGCGIAIWVKGDVADPNDLFYATPKILESEGVIVKMEHEVIKIDKAKKIVTVKNLKDNTVFEDKYDILVAATGSWPTIPPIPGVDLKGVEISKLYQHGQKLVEINKDKKIKNIAIIGAGYIGVELAEAFHTAKKHVVLFDLATRIMPKYYDEEFTSVLEGEMKSNGVDIRLGEKIKEFKGHEGKLTEVVTDKGTYPVDMVLMSVGFAPNTKLFEGVIDRDRAGAIVTNKFHQSSDPSIYAIGDCSLVYDNAEREFKHIALATTAVRTGVVTAINIVTKNGAPQAGFQGSNAINVFGIFMASTGMTELMAKNKNIDVGSKVITDLDKPKFIKSAVPVTLKVVWDKKDGRILGAQVCSKVNHTEIMYMFSLAILKNTTIGELPLIDIFFLPHINKPYNFITELGLEAAGITYMQSSSRDVKNKK